MTPGSFSDEKSTKLSSLVSKFSMLKTPGSQQPIFSVKAPRCLRYRGVYKIPGSQAPQCLRHRGVDTLFLKYLNICTVLLLLQLKVFLMHVKKCPILKNVDTVVRVFEFSIQKQQKHMNL